MKIEYQTVTTDTTLGPFKLEPRGDSKGLIQINYSNVAGTTDAQIIVKATINSDLGYAVVENHTITGANNDDDNLLIEVPVPIEAFVIEVVMNNATSIDVQGDYRKG